MKFKKTISFLAIISAATLLAGCSTTDTVGPVIEKVSIEKDAYYVGESFSVDVLASDDVSQDLSVLIEVTNPDQTISTFENEVTLASDGQHSLVAVVSDEAGNQTRSEPVVVNGFDPYAHWSDEQKKMMEDTLGYIIPKAMSFKETTEVSLSVNLNETVLGVMITNTGISEEEIEDFIYVLGLEGYTNNVYEQAYFATSILDSTHISVYDKVSEGYTHNLIQSYYYNGDYKIEARSYDYVMSHTWDETFVSNAINESYTDLIPAFSFASDNEEGIIYLTDYNHIMEGMGLLGAIHGKIYNVTIDEISAYLDSLTNLGYTGGSIDDLIEYETTIPMYMDAETYATVMIQISSYLNAEIPFYTLDIMCM